MLKPVTIDCPISTATTLSTTVPKISYRHDVDCRAARRIVDWLNPYIEPEMTWFFLNPSDAA
jgi:hypothetical protein